ncbi:MAG: hypothetical protein HYS27_24630 [Deltaproteobacteria bacterium]|nr:hypothetical protein [Deltaproteobacteria bacterium]
MRRLLLLLVALCGAPALAQDDLNQVLFGNKPKAFIEPSGYYAVILPSGFDCVAKVARHVDCKSNRGTNALLTLDVLDVPASATSDIAMLNQMDRFKQKPHFKKISEGRTKVDGSPAITVAYQYDYLGNVEYTVGVQQLIMVRGGKLYLIHLETPLVSFAAHKADLEQVYRSFKPARLDASGNPILEDLRPVAPKSDGSSADIERALKGGF